MRDLPQAEIPWAPANWSAGAPPSAVDPATALVPPLDARDAIDPLGALDAHGPYGAHGALAGLAWDELPPLAELVRAADGGAPEQTTAVRVCHDGATLYLRFDCADRDAWGTFARRDDPIYQEEVVEVFLAPGAADPVRYFELEVSPLGVLFDAIIANPTSRRAEMVIDTSWDCAGLRWQAGRGAARQDWWAALAIPWQALAPAAAAGAGALPSLWRGNFYRIERPRGAAAEFTAWSPTLAEPLDFHLPARFGVLAPAAPPR